MLERKICPVEHESLIVKTGIARRTLELYSYAYTLEKIPKSANDVFDSMLGFLSTSDALVDPLYHTSLADLSTHGEIENFSLHLSAHIARDKILPLLPKKEYYRDNKKITLDPKQYTLLQEKLIKYNQDIIKGTRNADPLLLQEYFLSKIAESTYRNGQNLEYGPFNNALSEWIIQIKNGQIVEYPGRYCLPVEISEVVNTREEEHSSKNNIIDPGNNRPPLPITFKDIAGYTDAKKQLSVLVQILTKNNVYKKAGIPTPTGIILHGPKGNGKTSLAYAFANECGWPFHELCLSEVLNEWLGQSEKRISSFLDQKGVLFLDEVHALGSDMGHSSGEGSQLITRIQTVIRKKLEIPDSERIILAATNYLDRIDSALKGRRLEKLIYIDYPTVEDCKEIIDYYLNKAGNSSEKGYNYQNVDSAKIAQVMIEHASAQKKISNNPDEIGFSCKEIQNVIYGIIGKYSESMLNEDNMKIPTTEDYIKQVRTVDLLARQN